MANGLETWENVTEGTVWVIGTDHRGGEQSNRIDGGQRAQLKTEDRENVELSRPGNNPFQNGRLRRIDADANPDQRVRAVTKDELREIALTEDNYFLREWLSTESELNVRRLRELVRSEKLGSYASSTMIDEIVGQRFPNMDYTEEQREIMATPRD